MENKLKKVVSGLLIICLLLFSLTACRSDKTESSHDSSNDSNNHASDDSESKEDTLASKIYGAIEPLSSNEKLIIGSLSGAPHGFTEHLIEKLGGYEYANLDTDVIVFGNGPIMVEAMASESCDVGLYGLGGVISGTIGQGIINIGPGSRDYDGLMIFAPNDSPIVQAGQTLEDSPGVYGTAELWKGQEVFCPVGTTLYYTLIKGIERFGLTADDILVTHMTPENTNTALRAGKCEVGGLWGAFSYNDINENFTPVIRAGDVGVNLITNYAATPSALKNKRDAVKKWMELYFVTIDWINESDENLDQAVEWFLEWNKDNGITSSEFEIRTMFEVSDCYTLEEAYEIINTPSKNGEYSKFVEWTIDPLKFFVEIGNYDDEDVEDILQPQYWDTTLLEEIYKEHN